MIQAQRAKKKTISRGTSGYAKFVTTEKKISNVLSSRGTKALIKETSLIDRIIIELDYSFCQKKTMSLNITTVRSNTFR